MSYKFQGGRYGENWNTLAEYAQAIELKDYEGVKYEKWEYRLLSPDGTVVKHWVGNYGDNVRIDILSDNPLALVFKVYDIDDATARRFCEAWLAMKQ